MFDFWRRWKAEYRALAVSPAGDLAVVGTANEDRDTGEAIIVSLPKGRVVRRWQPYAGEPAGVAAVAWSPCGRWIVTEGWIQRPFVPKVAAPKVKAWDANTGKQIGEFGDDSYPGGNLLQFSASGRRLLTRGPKRLHVWDFESGKRIVRTAVDGNLMHSAAISPDGEWVAIGGFPFLNGDPSSSLGLFEVSTLRLSAVEGCTEPLNEVLFTPDGRHVLTAGGENGIWEVGSGRKVVDFGSSEGLAGRMAVSEDQRYIAIAWDKDFEVFRTANGERVTRYEHKGRIGGLVFLPGARGIVTVDHLRNLRVWPMPRG